MNSRSVAGVLSLVLAATLSVAGCSSLPTSPAGTSSTPTNSGLFDPGSTDTALPATSTVTEPVSSSVYVRALLGGRVKAGSFTVVVPPLALTGDAIVTVRQAVAGSSQVELSITPESRNGFRLPVLLIADASPLGRDLISTSYISWWDPSTGKWVQVPGCSISVLNLTVTAPLLHFSTYRVENDGRAGW